MDGQELIQVNLRLPASALDSLTRLTEQLQRLAAAFQPQPGPSVPQVPQIREVPQVPQFQERGENTAFDFSKFQDPRAARDLPDPPAARFSETPLAPAAAAFGEVAEPLPRPASAGRTVNEALEDPAPAGSSPGEVSFPESAPAREFSALPDAPAGPDAPPFSQEDIPTAQPDPFRPVPAPQTSRTSPETPPPEIRTAEEPAWPEASPLPASQNEPQADIPPPTESAFPMASGPEAPQSRWDSLGQEAGAPASASLTPEAVSLAFQRDSRRYDSGFPLY